MLDHEESVSGVRVVRWNPPRPDATTGEVSRINNFGDLIGPLIVAQLVEGHAVAAPTATPERPRLLAVGSVLHLAEDYDLVWGSGVNGKVSRSEMSAKHLDIRAVRGPLSGDILRSRGHSVPVTYGDPALLLPLLFPQTALWALTKTRSMTVIPNFNDMSAFDPADPAVLSPRTDLWTLVRAIAESEFVVGSSLHAIIIAEALGVPARPITSAAEHYLKYFDYFAGTGRSHVVLATDVEEAIKLGGVRSGSPDLEGLLRSFPADLWTGYTPPAAISDIAVISRASSTSARGGVRHLQMLAKATSITVDRPRLVAGLLILEGSLSGLPQGGSAVLTASRLGCSEPQVLATLHDPNSAASRGGKSQPLAAEHPTGWRRAIPPASLRSPGTWEVRVTVSDVDGARVTSQLRWTDPLIQFPVNQFCRVVVLAPTPENPAVFIASRQPIVLRLVSVLDKRMRTLARFVKHGRGHPRP